jgi:cytochrome c oxidase subunit 4
MAATHKDPNYMAIFWWLFALTVTEVGVIFTGLPRVIVVIALIALALSKASLVAMYFMHLRFERRTMAMIAVTPIFLGGLLIFILIPDHSAVPHRTTEVAKPAAVSH